MKNLDQALLAVEILSETKENLSIKDGVATKGMGSDRAL
jgi:hypothetical protein